MNNLAKRTHRLKIQESFADAILSGDKTFEVRINDRGFQKGDGVVFICVNSEGNTIEHDISRKPYEITYVLSGWGIKEDHVVFGIRKMRCRG